MTTFPKLRFLRRAWLPAVALLLALAALAPAGAVSAAPLFQDDCTGTISGQVTDNNGAGIEGVRVIALPMATAIRPVDPNVQPPEALTDENGNYVVEGLCAGGYTVIAVLENPNRPLRGFYDLDADGDPDILVLSANDIEVEEIDIVLGTGANAPDPSRPAPAPRQCAIDDGAISGTVTDTKGDAVEGAVVMAFQATAAGVPSPSLSGTVRALTDENGGYTLEGMCEGDYFVRAQLAMNSGTIQGHYDSDNDGKPNVVGLSESEREATGIDIVLDQKVRPPNAPDPGRPAPDPGRPAPTPRQCAIDDGVIKGTVTDMNGDAVKGAEVSLISANGAVIGGSSALSRRPAITDADGNYIIEELCEGSYAVMARLRTMAGEIMGWHDADGDGGRDLVKLSEDMREAGEIDIVLDQKVRPPSVPDPQPNPPPAPRRCVMDDGAITGVVSSANGDVVEGAIVMAFQATASGRPATSLAGAGRALTDDQGMYRIEGLCEGAYFVRAQLATSAGMLEGQYDSDNDGNPNVVGLSETEREAAGIDIVLARKAQPPNVPDPGNPSPRPQPQPQPPRAPRCVINDGAISGMITDAEGNAIAGAQVLAVPASATTAAGSMPVAPMPVQSDADGNYEFSGLCEGGYQVLAFQQSNNGMRVGFHDSDGDGTPDMVNLHPNARTAEDVDVQLVALPGPGLPIDRGRTLPLPRPVPLPLPPASRW